MAMEVRSITEQELLSIVDVLNADAGDHSSALTMLENMGNAETFSMQESLVAQTLLGWATEAMDRARPTPTFERKSLLELYNDLDPDERDAIDLLPPERFKEELQRLNDPRRGRGNFRFRPSPR